MRAARIKTEGQAHYHCMSRVVDRRMILGDEEREKFRALMHGAETLFRYICVTETLSVVPFGYK